ncbi:IS21-like element helper ATPase IstB [bacterium]|nr:IS21-like element helper ATPase IstB [bacterium]
MNNAATLEKMNQMKLFGMARAFKVTLDTRLDTNFTTDELLAHLVDAEWDDRYNRKLSRLIRLAKFRYQASLEQLDFSINRNLDKNTILRFSDGNWIREKMNIIITGPTGVGKSFIAAALGHQACVLGFKTAYFNCSKLFPNLLLFKADGTYVKQINKIQKQDVLILDDFGLQKLEIQSRLALLEILEDRHGIKSTVIVSQLPVSSWHKIIGDKTIADAICDRIIHTAYRLEMNGESLRKKYKYDGSKTAT